MYTVTQYSQEQTPSEGVGHWESGNMNSGTRCSAPPCFKRKKKNSNVEVELVSDFPENLNSVFTALNILLIFEYIISPQEVKLQD